MKYFKSWNEYMDWAYPSIKITSNVTVLVFLNSPIQFLTSETFYARESLPQDEFMKRVNDSLAAVIRSDKFQPMQLPDMLRSNVLLRLSHNDLVEDAQIHFSLNPHKLQLGYYEIL